MRHLERDRRGLPVPFVVYRDTTGQPHFTINDTLKVEAAHQAGLCAICGDRLGVHKWFTGGPAAAFHKHGRYLDGPTHYECGRFALQTCPFLALAGRYTGRIDAATLKAENAHAGMGLLDSTMHPTQPAVFVFADASAYTRERATDYFNPTRPWKAVEFWRGGNRLEADEARWLIAADPDLARPLAELETWWPR